MPWSCFACNGRGGSACPGHAVAAAGSERHCCPAEGKKWFCDRVDCRGHSAPGPFIAFPAPLDTFNAAQRCPNDPGSMWYCRARGCQGHTRQGQDCRSIDMRDEETQRVDAEGPKFFCRWTGCAGHESPDHFHAPAEVRAAEARGGVRATHAAAINRTTALAPPARLRVAFKYFNYVMVDDLRAMSARDEYVSDERLWDDARSGAEPRTSWAESLWYSITRTGPGPARGYAGRNLRPVTNESEFRTLWGSRMTSAGEAGMPTGHGPSHVTMWPSSSPLPRHYVHIWRVNLSSGDRVPQDGMRVVEVRGETDWTETDSSGGSSRSSGGEYYTLLPDQHYFIMALPFRLSHDGMVSLAVLMEYSLSAPGNDARMFRLFRVQTETVALAGEHGAQRMELDLWLLPVVNPFHIALRQGHLILNRFEFLSVLEPARGDSGLSEAQAKRRYASMYTELLGQLARGNSDFAESIDVASVGNDCKRYSLYHRRAAGGLIISLAYMLNSRPMLELEYLTDLYPEDMNAGGGWWALVMGSCAGVLARHSAGIEVYRLRQDGAAQGDFVSPISKWFFRHIDPSPTSVSGPALPVEQPTGASAIVGYIGNAGEVANSLYEAWTFVEVLRSGAAGASISTSSFNSRLNAAAEKLRTSLSSERFWGSRLALNATRLARFISIGNAAYRLYSHEWDYSSYASAASTAADLWTARGNVGPVAVARCMMLKTALSAVETVRSGSAAMTSATVGDTSAAVGSGMVAAASGMTVAWAVVAGTAPTGPIGWCIGAMALSGGLIVALTTDDDIEVYGRYCYYSRNRLTEWPTSFVGANPMEYLKSDVASWGENNADGFKANLEGLLCYIYKVHAVGLTAAPSGGRDDSVKIELHATPAGASIRVKLYYVPVGFMGTAGAAVGAGEFKIVEYTLSSFNGRRATTHSERADITADRATCELSSDSSKWEVELKVTMSTSQRQQWRLWDAFVRVSPFATGEFSTPASGWYGSSGHVASLP